MLRCRLPFMSRALPLRSRPAAVAVCARSLSGTTVQASSNPNFTSDHQSNLDTWRQAASSINWSTPFTKVLDDSRSPFMRWFAGGKLNTCFNCLDRHIIAGFGEQNALIFESPVSGTQELWSYNRLFNEVSSLAQVLQARGVEKGDRVMIYMPNTPQAAAAMLACARIGAVHCVVFGGFAPNELAVRIRDCRPRVLMYSSCGLEGAKVIPYQPLVEEALKIVANSDISSGSKGHDVDVCVVFQRPQSLAVLSNTARDSDWTEAVANHPPTLPGEGCVEVESSHPLYVLYTSGTTGAPKGIVRDTGGHAVALAWSMPHIYDIAPGEVWWAASDVGWVVGHSFGVYGPLLHRATSVIYEGKPVGTPDATQFWRVATKHKVAALFTAPTALRAIKQVDPEGLGLRAPDVDLSAMRTLFLAGERADPATVKWAESKLNKPVRDHWWQTESGWPIAANQVGSHGYLPVKYGSSFTAVQGWDIRIFDSDSDTEVPRGTMGRIAVKLPTPPGFMLSLYNNDARFLSSYMTEIPGHYNTGDAGIIDDDGYVHIMTRTDDVINVAGHRLSTGAMEEIVADHPGVAEVAVVGVQCELRGQVPLALFVRLPPNANAPDHQTDEEIVADLVAMVRKRIGAVACFKDGIAVSRLPKTRSGKILRGVLRSMANGTREEDLKIPATLEDRTVLGEIWTALSTHQSSKDVKVGKA